MAGAKPLYWIGSSLKDLTKFPDEVREVMAYALDVAVNGGKAANVKPLKGFNGASVLEIVDDFDGDTYRAVYTVRLANAVYVLHAFQKKSTTGSKTSKRDRDLISKRLAAAETLHAETRREGKAR
ncbi:MAG: hypothetical protein JWO59_1788 [Chloroflexi bacterium]|nr:hypothetical protein [Chloroflexota bacterium]